MKINRLTDYATLLMCEMASVTDDILSAKHLSKKTKIGEATVIKLLKILVKRGLLRSYRGNTGGYKLNRSLSEIRILDIIVAIEGNVSLTLCGINSQNSCEYSMECKVKHGWNRLHSVLVQILESFTIKDFVEDSINFQLTKVKSNDGSIINT